MPTPPTEAPWLDVMRSRVGTLEVEGDGSNPVILDWFKAVGHGEIRSDAVAWCSITVGAALVECGYPIPPRDINMMARSYLSYGVKCEPQPGAIAIWPRGTGWQGHVNIVETVTPDGKVICIGGNQTGMASDADTLAKIEALLALKAPLASPTFIGVPAVPTASPGTSTTQAASTAFAKALADTKVASATVNGGSSFSAPSGEAIISISLTVVGGVLRLTCTTGAASGGGGGGGG